MSGDKSQKMLISVCLAAGALLGPALLRGQSTGLAPVAPSSAQPGGTETGAAGALADSLADLRAQMQDLREQMADLRGEAAQARKDAADLRQDLVQARVEIATLRGSAVAGEPEASLADFRTGPARAGAAPQHGGPNDSDRSSSSNGVSNGQATGEDESQQLTDSKLNDLYQTKVESGSKYRLRLSGLALMNLFDNRGTVDSQDIPQVALPADPFGSPSAFGGSLRQSQIGLEAFGPDLFGAHTSASIRFDFAGGFAGEPNGYFDGIVRLRTGVLRLDWTKTSIVAGQDYLFFSPLAPSSLVQTAIPALSYSGNLWAWAPQVRVEHRVELTENSSLLFQGGILDSLSGDVPFSNARYPTWGEQSGYPALAGRGSWTYRIFGQALTAGIGGFFGRQNWAVGRSVNGWAGTADLAVPIGSRFTLTSAFYRGSAVGGLGGAIGQDVLFKGSMLDPTVRVIGLDSVGGWAQLQFRLAPKWQINGAWGMDNPFASEMRPFVGAVSYYGPLLSRNMSATANFIYRVRSDVLASVEYRHIRTNVLDAGSNSADLVGIALGYQF